MFYGVPAASESQQHSALHRRAGRHCTRPEGPGKVENMPGCYITTAADSQAPAAAAKSFPPQESSFNLLLQHIN